MTWTDDPASSGVLPVREFVTYAEASLLTGFHRSTIRAAVVAGHLPRYGGPRSARFRYADLVEWVESGAATQPRGYQGDDHVPGLPAIAVGF